MRVRPDLFLLNLFPGQLDRFHRDGQFVQAQATLRPHKIRYRSKLARVLREVIMKRSLVVFVGIALSMLNATVTSVFAQGPLPPPTLIRPLTNGIPNVPGSDAISTGDGARVAFTHVDGATHYHICFRAPGNFCQDQAGQTLQSMFPLTARANPSIPLAAGGTIEFFLPISDGFQGGRIQWEVKSCTGPNITQCGQTSPFQEVIVLLPSARPRSGATTTIPANRGVTFAWNNHNLGDAAPQLIVLPNAAQPALQTIFAQSNPTVANFPGLSIALEAGNQNCTLVTGFACQMTLPAQLGPAVKWAVANCRNYQGKGRRCSQLITTWQVMKVANFFSTGVVPTFLSPRCINCHAVAADNFQNDPPNNLNGGLPSTHPGVNSGTNCASCHTNALLPTLGNINPGWHAPPASMDFRRRPNESQTQHVQRLCSMAQQNASGVSGFQHLTQDKLILWAVNPNQSGNVQLPSIPPGQVRPPAPPANIAAWSSAVFTWWFTTQKACN